MLGNGMFGPELVGKSMGSNSFDFETSQFHF